MSNLFDILLKQILDNEPKEKTVKESEEESQLAEDKIKAEVKRRAKKRLEEAFKKAEQQAQEAMAKGKRKALSAQKTTIKQRTEQAYMDSLASPTKRLRWEVIAQRPEQLQAFMGEQQMFSIKRGILTYNLHLSSPKELGENSILHRAKKVRVGNNFSSSSVYILKERAERVLAQIEALEKQAIAKRLREEQEAKTLEAQAANNKPNA